MKKLVLLVAALGAPVAAQEKGVSDAPSASADDLGTSLSWELEVAPAFGDNPEVAGVKVLEDNALSGAVGLKHKLPSHTYFALTATGEASPEFAAPRVAGARVGGEFKIGQSVLLGGSGDKEDNRDRLDFEGLAKISHGTEELEDVRRSYTDRELGVQAVFTNILWLYRDLGDENRMNWRTGPYYEFTGAWTHIDSNRADRDSRALTGTALVGYQTRRGVGLKASLEYENVRYRRVFIAGDRRVDHTITAYAGVDIRKLIPGLAALSSVEVGGEFSKINSSDDGEDDSGVYLRLKIGFGGSTPLTRR